MAVSGHLNSVLSTDPKELLSEVFEVKRKRCRTTLTTTSITWEILNQPNSFESVPLAEVVAVGPAEFIYEGCHGILASKRNTKTVFHETSPLNIDGFQIHFINRVWKFKWKLANVVFGHSDYNTVSLWINQIQKILKGYTHRPQRLMVFINPYGGKKQAVQIYERKIVPLFNLARIDAHVIVTQRSNHAKDLLMDMSLNKVDGIVGVGGDGTFNELLNGLIMRNQKDCNVDVNDTSATLVKPKLRIGIIPSGSTDALSFVTSGVNDPVTAALHIILGDSIGVDVSGVYSGSRLLFYCSTMLSYGYFGDVLKASEKCRWMGPHRYDWSGFKQLIKLKSYKGEIKFNSCPKSPSSPIDGPRCVYGCETCASAAHYLEMKNDEQSSRSEWQVKNGDFAGVNIAITSCMCTRSMKGISPNAHIGDGYTDLILVSKCSKLNYLRFLLTLALPCFSPFNLNFVQVHRVREVYFKSGQNLSKQEDLNEWDSVVTTDSSSSESSVWNCDGEILSEQYIGVKVHCQLINLFARGIEDVSDILQTVNF